MDDEPRRLRADAERNRRRLILAATELFSERGLEVGVGEIAERAGVGRGTLFRHFASKEILIAAVVVARIEESIGRARARLEDADPTGAVLALIDEAFAAQTVDRALIEAIGGPWVNDPAIHAAHSEMLGVIDELLGRAQAQGGIRADVSGIDVLLLVKGVCEVQRTFLTVDPTIGRRQLALVKAAIAEAEIELPGEPPTAADLDRAVSSPAATCAAVRPLSTALLADSAGE